MKDEARAMALAVAVSIVALFAVVAVVHEDAAGDGTPSVDQSGSVQDDAYAGGAVSLPSWYTESGDMYIGTETQLRELASYVNAGNDLKGRTIVLQRNIELSSEQWVPIGKGIRSGSSIAEGSTPFRGTFDGNVFMISGLTITGAAYHEDAAYGLFGIVDGGTVKDLTIDKVNIELTGSEMAGGIVGMLTGDGTVSGCWVGSYTDGSKVSAVRGNGGVVGRIIVSGTVESCTNCATVTATGANVGGIVGAAYYDAVDKRMEIRDCINHGSVTGTSAVGGIVGLSVAFLEECQNDGEVRGNGYSVGGIAGEQQNYGGLSGCTNLAPVSNVGIDSNVNVGMGTGGIVGWVRYSGSDTDYPAKATISITGSTNRGAVHSLSTHAGGIVGALYHSGVIRGCMSGGNIDGTNFTGGIIGGMQTVDGSHPNDGCRLLIFDNVVDSAITVTGGPQTGNTLGHFPSAEDSKSKNCKVPHGSNWTVYGNYVESDPVYEAIESVAVIEVGDEVYGYHTLEDAFANAEDGSTITLLEDVSGVGKIRIDDGRKLSLDLNGHDVTFEKNGSGPVNCIELRHGSLRIIGEGTMKEADDGRYFAPVMVFGSLDASDSEYSCLYVGEDVTLIGWSAVFIDRIGENKVSYGIVVDIYGHLESKTDITGSEGHAMYINGYIQNTGENSTVINVHDGASITSGGNGIYAAGYATWNFGEADVVALDALSIKAGVFNITGGTYRSEGELVDPPDPVGSGSEPTGAAVSITCNSGYASHSISVNISGGEFTSVHGYGLYEAVTTEDTVDFASITITGGHFAGKAGSLKIVDSEDVRVSGGTFSSDVSAYCDADHISWKEGDVWEVREAVDVTYTLDDGETVTKSIPKGSTVGDLGLEPLDEGYGYHYYVNGNPWDEEDAIGGDITMEIHKGITDLTVSIAPGDSNDRVSFVPEIRTGVRYESVSYTWFDISEEDDAPPVSQDRILFPEGYGTYGVVVVITDPEGTTGIASATIDYSEPEGDSGFNIDNSGDDVVLKVNGNAALITSDGAHSDVSLNLTFGQNGNDGDTIGIEIKGDVGGHATVSVNEIDIGDYEEELKNKVPSEQINRSVGVDVSISNISDFEMYIKIPVGEIGEYVKEALAFFVSESGLEPVDCFVMGGEVWILTDHNTPYIVVPLSYSETPISEQAPPLGQEPEIPDIPSFPPFIPSEDPVPLPPAIVVEDDGHGDQDPEKVAAVAAAAVVAAILAAFIIMDYRKR